jgi:hypothetical protein
VLLVLGMWDLHFEKNKATVKMQQGNVHTLLERFPFGFPRGTSTPSSMTFDSNKSGAI